MSQEQYANPSAWSLSCDQFNQSGSANGKMLPEVLLLLTTK